MSGRAATVTIERGGFSDLERLRPLWLEALQRHRDAGPSLGPYLDDESSWAARLSMFRSVFADEGSFLLLAFLRSELAGYLMVHLTPSHEQWTEGTWATGPVIAEIDSFVVGELGLSQGVGDALLDAADAELSELGIEDVVAGANPGDEALLKLLERHGFLRTRLELTRFVGRAGRIGPLTVVP